MRNVANTVNKVLKEKPIARKDDFELILSAISIISPEIKDKTFEDVMHNHLAYKIPSFESITRARRSEQKDHPELTDDETVYMRSIEEEIYRDTYGG